VTAPDVDGGVPVDDSLNTVCTTNEEGFARLLALYARPGQVIVDPTHGHGKFWANVDRGKYNALCTDATDGVDLRRLPYADASVDVEVLDPPYRYTPVKNTRQEDSPGHGVVDGLYNLKAAGLTNTDAVIRLYEGGFKEAYRVLRHGGFLIVKCQDTVQDGKNIWVHDELRARAEALGFAMRDMLIVTPRSVLKTRWSRQRHLRKAHSYFLVFRKGGHFPFGIPSMEER
jgi:DNA modification methylase